MFPIDIHEPGRVSGLFLLWNIIWGQWCVRIWRRIFLDLRLFSGYCFAQILFFTCILKRNGSKEPRIKRPQAIELLCRKWHRDLWLTNMTLKARKVWNRVPLIWKRAETFQLWRKACLKVTSQQFSALKTIPNLKRIQQTWNSAVLGHYLPTSNIDKRLRTWETTCRRLCLITRKQKTVP